MNAAQMIIDLLQQAGMKYIFGIPGSSTEDLNHAIEENEKIKLIVTKHEEGAAFMADGYSRVSGKLSACIATAGPGATNLITGLATSYVDGISVVALTGQVAISLFGKGAFQETGTEGVNMVSIFRNFTRYSAMVLSEQRAEYMIEKAIRMAYSSPSGPVHLSCPVDVMDKQVPKVMIRRNTEIMSGIPRYDKRLFDRERVRMASLVLGLAKKPVIVAGWGVALSRGAEELLELAEHFEIPVATSPKAKGVFPETHRLSLGVLGVSGASVARDFIINEEIDVLLAVGTSFNEMMTSGWDERLLPARYLIQIDADPEKISKNYIADIGMVGDASTVLKEITYAIKRGVASDFDVKSLRDITARERLKDLKIKYEKAESDPIENGELYHPANLVKDIQKGFPKNTIYFSEIGDQMYWCVRYLVIDEPHSFFVPLGFGGKGYETAACVGARLASGDRPVVAMCSDGSFLMNGMEIATAVEYNIPVVWVIFNCSEGNGDLDGGDSRRSDFAKLAEGLGAKAITVKKPGEITPELTCGILESEKPTVLDVWIDKSQKPPAENYFEKPAEHTGD